MNNKDRYAVVGHPVAHSQSPFIHAAFAAQTGEPVSYDRLLCPLDGFAPALREFAAGGASGCNVTMPFKFEAFGLVAKTTPRARIAVNASWPGVSRTAIGPFGVSTRYAPMCCVMPPASPAATVALRIRSRSDVLPWST
jgi:hypothetical protein